MKSVIFNLVTDVEEVIFFINIWNRIIHIKSDKSALISTIHFDRWKKVCLELFPFKDNASNLDILKSLDKLWDCKYLTKLYIEITP